MQEKRRGEPGALAHSGKGHVIRERLCHDRQDRVTLPAVQTALRLVYPPRCTVCGVLVESDFAICGSCWRDTPFIEGMCCDACGVPLPGDARDGPAICDGCMKIERPWLQGRAAMLYRDNGRKLVLALKHGDRHDVLRPAARWLARAARPLLRPDTLIAPVPLHWMRMISRRYNQSALLSAALARETGHAHCPDLLLRPRRTRQLGGMSREERFATLDQAITIHARRRHRITGRNVLLVDDVMTTGATLSAATQACYSAGAAEVRIVTLARAAKED